MSVIEIERTFLAKFLPEEMQNSSKKEIVDIYFPVDTPHTALRLRKNGNDYELTKKQPVSTKDFSKQIEQTVILNEFEFRQFAKLPGKKLRKTRYKYPLNGVTAEIDVFHDGLAGLVLVDIEFEEGSQYKTFEIPDFCLVEVTQEDFTAGHNLAGKLFQEIETDLHRFHYVRISE